MSAKNRLPYLLAACALFPLASAPAAGQQAKQQGPLPYTIVDGKVDESTFLGWKAYHSACHACHGVDAVGTPVAPSLVERVKSLSDRDFAIKVLTSYRLVVPQSEASGDDSTAMRQVFLEEVLRRARGDLVMPAWEHETTIQPHVMDLYAYLRARADGALGPGKPQKINE